MHPRFHARNEIQLPCPPLDLPNPERRETGGEQQRKAGEQGSLQGAASSAIMFMLRWYMIQSDPARTMPTSTAVKI